MGSRSQPDLPSGAKAQSGLVALSARLEVVPYPVASAGKLVTTRNDVAFRMEVRCFSARAEAEDRKLRKDLAFGGPCLEGTLRRPTLASESRPVAGTIEGSDPS